MTPAHRREARVALAMLFAGAVVLVGSVLGLLAIAALAATAPFDGRAGLVWIEGWCLIAAGVAAWNARAGIAMMSAFDWRPLPPVLLLSAGIVVASPTWWAR